MQTIPDNLNNTNITDEQQVNNSEYNQKPIQILNSASTVNFLASINNIENFIGNSQINEYPCCIVEDSKLPKNLLSTSAFGSQSISIIKSNEISNIEFANNNIFATTTENTAIINKLIDGNWQQIYIDHGDKIDKITFSPDGNYIIISSDSLHKIWNISTNEPREITHIENLYSHDIHFRSDSKRFVIKIQAEPLQIYDLHDSQWECVLSIHRETFKNIFDTRQGKFIHSSLPKNITEDNWLSFIVQRFAVSSILHGSESYGDAELFEELRNLVHISWWKELDFVDQPGINALTYSNDMRLLYACPTNEKSFIFEYIDNQWQLKLKFDGTNREVSFSPDNQRIITSFTWIEKRIYKTTIWNIAADKAVKELCLDDTKIAKFSQDSKHIITSKSSKEKITIWELVDGKWNKKTTIKNQHCIMPADVNLV